MKRVCFLIIIVLLSTLAINAQSTDRPNFDSKEMASRTIGELASQINLSLAIQDSLKVTFTQFFDEVCKKRESGNRPDIKKMESERDLKVKSLLTNEQFTIYQIFMAEKKLRRTGTCGEVMPDQP